MRGTKVLFLYLFLLKSKVCLSAVCQRPQMVGRVSLIALSLSLSLFAVVSVDLFVCLFVGLSSLPCSHLSSDTFSSMDKATAKMIIGSLCRSVEWTKVAGERGFIEINSSSSHWLLIRAQAEMGGRSSGLRMNISRCLMSSG